MLDNDLTPRSALNIFVKDMGIVTSSARSQGFPLPLSSVAEQLFLSASAQGYGLDDDSGLVRTYIPTTPTLVHDQSKAQTTPSGPTPSATPLEISKVAFIGLGAMGIGMAKTLVRAGYHVAGFDVYEPSVQEFAAAGEKATAATSTIDVAERAEVLILMVQNAAQAEDVLFGSGKVASTLPSNAIIVLSSTVPPSFAKSLGQRLFDLGTGLQLIDAPVSGGVVRAAKGELTVCLRSPCYIQTNIDIF